MRQLMAIRNVRKAYGQTRQKLACLLEVHKNSKLQCGNMLLLIAMKMKYDLLRCVAKELSYFLDWMPQKSITGLN